MERNVLTVMNVNTYIKQIMDRDFILKQVWVQGEVSNFKYHSSGHLYFTLKDDQSSISCVMFRSYAKTADVDIQNGMKIIVQGSVSVYERSGQYQIYIKKIVEDGVGKLYKEYEKLKKQLEAEGLFDKESKKSIPKYAKHIGIITSDTGAAIRDITQVANRRNPYTSLTLYPSLVQGALAAANIVRAIDYFNHNLLVDVIILGRGGGSIEDLWPFNEEVVARAIYMSTIPIISAVGHETDFTIADFVADFRAPTPSAAAEIAVYEEALFKQQMNQYKHSINQLVLRQIKDKKKSLELLQTQLNYQNPLKRFERKYEYIAELEDRLKLYMERILNKKRHQVALEEEKLKGLSPYHRLKNGYAYINNGANNKISSVKQVKADDMITITLSDGKMIAKIQEVIEC